MTSLHPSTSAILASGMSSVRVRATTGWDLTQSQVAFIARGVEVTAVALTAGG